MTILLPIADNIRQQNEAQAFRLAQAIDRVMNDTRLTPEEKKEEITRLGKVLHPIPQDAKYFFRDYGYEEAQPLEWYWSITFGCWGCKVRFADGYVLCTYPKPNMIPITDEDKIELTKLGFYDEYGNSDLLIDEAQPNP